MNTNLVSVSDITPQQHLLILADEGHFEWADTFFNDILTAAEIEFLKKVAEQKTSHAIIPHTDRIIMVQFLKEYDNENVRREKTRRAANNMLAQIKHYKIDAVTLVNRCGLNTTYQYVEGLVLSNYQFLKYFTKAADLASPLKTINVHTDALSASDLEWLTIICEATCIARDLVNEPLSYLTAVQLSKEFEKLADNSGFSIQVLDKIQIEALKMGGLLAVNKGSVDPPTFNIMEYKPENPRNKQPIILVGKGVVYDTGGLNIKIAGMEDMKCDMAGAAIAGTVIYAAAKAKLPLHIISLVPATDNRPGGNAYVAGDVLNMYDGTTVEMLNSDAEGRLILADALAFAKKYNPELVIDFATLTGAAARAVGAQATAYMGTADEAVKWQLENSGFSTYERLIEFPLWDEYGEMIKSSIADIKNIGGPEAGMITAGKFLEHFIDYPWLHLDIAGPAFLSAPDNYRPKGGTGVGVRLMLHFLKQYANR